MKPQYMQPKILLVGCGNIGSRHLQAISKLSLPLQIAIVEPNESSVSLAKSRLKESSQNHSNQKITWLKSISELSNEFDLVIVATNSNQRVNLINRLLELGNKRFLIEKMVCQSKQEYESLLNDLEKNNAKAWVNTNRRYFPIYQKLKELFQSQKEIKFTITAGNKGLGSNAIHFLDLFLWFLDSEKISLNGDLLLDKLYPNKRGKKFFEFNGTIFGINNSSIISISFLPIENLSLIIEIINKNYHVLIDESNEKIIKVRNLESIDSSFNYLHVSEITQNIVLEILKNDDCSLPSVRNLFFAHCELFRIFNSHIKKLRNKEPTLCPIT